MYQILILISVIALVYLIARSARKPKVNLSEKSTEMARCQKCNLNLPKSEAIQSGKKWLCSSECQA